MLSKKIFLFVSFFVFTCHAAVPAQLESHDLAAELKNFIETDVEYKQRCDVEDDDLRDMFDAVDRAILIAKQERSPLSAALATIFYNGYPGGALQQMLKGLICLSPEKIPQIHAVVKELADRYGMPTPPIFLAGDEKLFNAMATAFGQGTAMVVLGRKLVENMNDAELRAILAHELAHVKQGHVLKNMGAFFTTAGVLVGLYLYIDHKLTQAHDNCVLARSMPALISVTEDYCFYKNIKTFLPLAAIPAILIASVVAMVTVTRANEQEADVYAMAVTKDPAAFVGAMKSLNHYYVDRLTKFLDDYELLLKKIDVLNTLNPTTASIMLEQAQAYGRAMIAATRAAIEKDTTHPALNTRIAYGQAVCDHPEVLEPKA